ncbi:MAG: DNA polymerase III subunit alpha [Rickettsiales bacterium]|jgi:DNA polymerase-3 subunit alpha|nr:DNA polymerase III subunit alpha [Rickettsiales bacterium]
MFIHLRNHTEYSLAIGAIRIKDMIFKAKEFGMSAVAMTDCGNMFGALEFSIAACKEGIQPIVGCEFMIEFENVFKRKWSDHFNVECLSKIVLIAQTDEGFNNLMSLASDNFLLKQEYRTPRIYWEWLKNNNKGIICLTSGWEGIIGKLLLQGNREMSEKILREMSDVFGDRLYMEINRHGWQTEIDTESYFLEFAMKYGIPLIASNDNYFLNRKDFRAQDILSCILDGRYETEKNRKKQTSEHYFKSPQEIAELFSDIPEAIENSINISKRIRTMAYKRKPTLPHFPLPQGISEKDYMRKISEDGLNKRLEQKFKGDNIDKQKQVEITEKYFNRLSYEIDVIEKMGFSGYFIIVSDFIIWSKENSIPVGPGRGSGAGSVVAWSLNITNIDPIDFDISFERFLNPERISMPDFDIDFCQRGREKTIRYVQNKYGKDMVAQIITFGKLQSRAVVKDVGRVLQIHYNETDKISKQIPQGDKLEDALKRNPDIRLEMQKDKQIEDLINISLSLEGLNRHSSVHAAGIVIGDKPLREICPLYLDKDAEMPTIQYTMKYAEEAGLVKFDFLGLSTLTVIKDTLEFLMKRGIKIDIDNVPYSDSGVYEMLSDADTLGVFQIESSGMRSILKQLKPNRIEDITALVALYRPGPMGSIPSYIKRKNGDEKIECLHPSMMNILEKSYGIIVYQDQVMNLARDLAGYSMGGADLLRRAMGKKNKEEMDKQRDTFVNGAILKTKILNVDTDVEIPGIVKHSNVDIETANKIFDLMAEFASYGFNLAHATAYGIISYQTAYLKHYFPVEFNAASMNDSIVDSDRISVFIQDLKKHNIKVLLPDVNESSIYFKAEYIGDKDKKICNSTNDIDYSFNAKHRAANFTEDDLNENVNYGIRYGLSAVKGVGVNVAEAIVVERNKNGKFIDIYDFAKRFDTKVINKKTIEALVKSGVFDSIHNNRRQIHDSFEALSKYCKDSSDSSNKNSNLDLFGISGVSVKTSVILPNIDDWEKFDKIQKEFESFGFYISGHPLDEKKDVLIKKGVKFINELENLNNNDKVKISGVVVSTSIKSSAKGRYAFINITDPTGIVELLLYSNELLIKYKSLLETKAHNQLLFECNIRNNSEQGSYRVIINDIKKLDEFLLIDEKKYARETTKIDGERKVVNFVNRSESDAIKDISSIVMRQSDSNVVASLNTVIKKISIHIMSCRVIQDIATILNSTKSSSMSNYTKIILCVGDKRVDIGEGYSVTLTELNRLKKINNINIEINNTV